MISQPERTYFSRPPFMLISMVSMRTTTGESRKQKGAHERDWALTELVDPAPQSLRLRLGAFLAPVTVVTIVDQKGSTCMWPQVGQQRAAAWPGKRKSGFAKPSPKLTENHSAIMTRCTEHIEPESRTPPVVRLPLPAQTPSEMERL